MKFARIESTIGLLLVLSIGMVGCGGGAAAPPPAPQPPPPSPTISSISPTSATAGSAAFSLTVNGANFADGATVQWNGSNRATTFVSSTKLTAAISSTDLAAPGSASVSVRNPGPNGLGSGTTNFQIDPANPTAVINFLSPQNVLVGGPDFTLTISGDNFVSGAVVQWNGAGRSTSFASSTQLTAVITASDIAKSGQAQVTVLNPLSFVSNPLGFLVADPTPVLGSISPTNAIVGGQGFVLTANGSGFVSASLIQWDSSDLATTFVSSSQLTAAVPAGNLSCCGRQVSIQVINPNALSQSELLGFELDNPKPTLTSLSPPNLMAGAAPFTLTVNGSGFVNGANVQWNGSVRSTQFLDSTKLTVAIPASDVAAQGTAQVTVVNPAPSLGPSAAAAFTIDPLTSNPAPTITSLSDTSAPAGWPGFPLTVKGTGFVEATTVQVNGLNRPTDVLSSTELKAAIPASALASPGTAQVAVFNPSPGGGTSSALPIIVQAVPPGAVGVIERSSIANDLSEPNGPSVPAVVSGDGRFVVFSSQATNLVLGETNDGAFLRDTCLGAAPDCVPSVSRVSLFRGSIAISANGRFVASAEGIFDTCFGAPAGCVQTLLAGSHPVDSLSADGRFAAALVQVTFTMCDEFDNCVPGTNAVNLSDTCAGVSSGCTPNTQAITPEGNFGIPAISPDGRFVVYEQFFTGPSGLGSDILMYDSCQGAPTGCTPSSLIVSTVEDRGRFNSSPTVSAGGRYVAYEATSIVNDEGFTQVKVRDTCIGAPSGCTPTTTAVAVANDGSLGNSHSFTPSISADGRYVVFVSAAANLVSDDTNGVWDVFLRDTCAGVSSGCTPSTVRVSVALDGAQGDGSSFNPQISADGRFVVFVSEATKLGPGDMNGLTDVYLARH